MFILVTGREEPSLALPFAGLHLASTNDHAKGITSVQVGCIDMTLPCWHVLPHVSCLYALQLPIVLQTRIFGIGLLCVGSRLLFSSSHVYLIYILFNKNTRQWSYRVHLSQASRKFFGQELYCTNVPYVQVFCDLPKCVVSYIARLCVESLGLLMYLVYKSRIAGYDQVVASYHGPSVLLILAYDACIVQPATHAIVQCSIQRMPRLYCSCNCAAKPYYRALLANSAHVEIEGLLGGYIEKCPFVYIATNWQCFVIIID